MNFKTGIQIHNKFDIRETNIFTGRQKWYKAENIVVDQIYERILDFNTYFNYIIFGKGSSTPLVTDTTMGINKIGAKSAEAHSLVRAFPQSAWTKKCRLGANDYNNQYIREVGIGYDDTNLCTHALITDSEGKVLEIEKTSVKIIDIFATVYVTLYDVDWGLAWVGTGLRDYLTGASMSSDKLGVTFLGQVDDALRRTVSGSRTKNKSEKWVKISVEFNEQYYNKDIQYIHWINGGLRAIFPRTGKFANHQRTGIAIGQGDGDKTVFTLPNKKVNELVVKVDGVVVSNYAYDLWDKITFDIAVDSGKPVTADYKCDFIPKDEGHILKAHFKVQYGASEPEPVMPPKPLPQGIPGVEEVIKGTSDFGYFGVVSAENLISGNDLCDLLDLTAGTLQNSDAGWLKFVDDGKIKFVAKKTFRYNLSWDAINAVGAVFGDKIIQAKGIRFAVRLLSTEEWNKLMYPVHKDHPDGAPDWWDYEDCDLHVHSSCGNGSYSWTSTPSGSNRVTRGYSGVSSSTTPTPTSTYIGNGFRPVLEVL